MSLIKALEDLLTAENCTGRFSCLEIANKHLSACFDEWRSRTDREPPNFHVEIVFPELYQVQCDDLSDFACSIKVQALGRIEPYLRERYEKLANEDNISSNTFRSSYRGCDR